MRTIAVIVVAAACSSPEPVAPNKPTQGSSSSAPERWQPPADWQGWRHEPIPFPLDFAPTLAHRGVEELWFAPKFFEPGAAGYWSYTFAWRLDDAAELDARALGDELTVYFRGLIAAVDSANEITARDQIVVTATPDRERFRLAGRVFDAFKTKQPVELAGWAQRTRCANGSLWRFVLAPPTTGVRAQLDELAARAACGQPVPAKPTPPSR